MPERVLWWGYNLLLGLAWPWIVIGSLLRGATGRRRWATAWQRLGWQLPEVPPAHCRIWIHALSLGETHSVVPLVEAWKTAFPESAITFSTATETGQDAARRVLAKWVSDFCFMPHDFPWSMVALMRRIRPQVMVLVETDVWPNLLWSCYRYGIPCVLVNARLSQRSYARLRRLRAFVRPIWKRFSLVFVQSIQDCKRFRDLGLDSVTILDVGNLKFDSHLTPLSEQERSLLRDETGIDVLRPVWIAGSTHDGEERVLLEVHQRLLGIHPEALLILAPRQVQRAVLLEQWCHRLGLTVGRRSRGEGALDRQILILDTLGELAHFYALAGVAFIGGSLVPFGGHNPLEPLAQGVPMVWGGYLDNFRQVEEVLLESGCARRIVGTDQLFESVRQWVSDSDIRKRVAEFAEVVFNQHAGSSLRIVARIRWLLEG
jgi:3-deoxy-D-manno-octulosonic-acid transferase